ncbi:ribosomal-processing cysteine protease Prp [Alicyclobacillus shizuokensis]|uniref:ribosomal-processing cysteine protease Prp n=1 Tax=Alicyclobacillus shizuokensis TaxID=392014 RepID=UPI00082E437D|nr:ribosomal-processing cysteine protease Prp [Alicyclobacillus shizuokensis]
MIRVVVGRDFTGKIERVEIHGHANFGDPGTDIVCAAVSVLSRNTVSSIRELLGVDIRVKSRPGYLQVDLPPLLQSDQVQLLLRCLLHGLENLAMEFPENVQVQSSVSPI